MRTCVNGAFAVAGKLLIASEAAMCTFLKTSPSFSAAFTRSTKRLICPLVNGSCGSYAIGQCEKIPSQSRFGSFFTSRITSIASCARMPRRPMPLSILKWTFTVLFARTAAAETSFASARSVTGRMTPAFTISGISSGRTDDSIWTSNVRFVLPSTLMSSSASNGSATPN